VKIHFRFVIELRAFGLSLPLRTIQRLYMCRLKCFWMRLRRINRPKAALITAQQLLLIVVEKCEAVKRECARAEGVGLAEGEARAAKRPQGHAREP